MERFRWKVTRILRWAMAEGARKRSEVRDIHSTRPQGFSNEMGISRITEHGECGPDSKYMKALRLSPGI